MRSPSQRSYQNKFMTDSLQPQFTEVLILIKTAQQKVIATANQELIKLYWSIGKHICDRFLRCLLGDRRYAKFER